MTKNQHLLLLFSHVILLRIALIADVASAVSIKEYPYLYAEKAGPIEEHIAPQGDKKRRSDYPEFLYNPNNKNYRVVEFYVHWCGVCRHYSNHYIKFTKKLESLAKKKDVPITFHTVSCVPNKPLCRRQKADAFPVVRLLKPGETEGVDLKHYDAKPKRVFKELGIDTTGLNFEDDVEDDWDVSTPIDRGPEAEGSLWRSLSEFLFGMVEAPVQVHETHFIARSREDLKNDIHLSFDFAMRNSVFTGDEDTLSEAQIEALYQWILLLHKTLPSPWTDMQDLLKQLIRNFRYISKKESYMMKFLDKYPPKVSQWSESCSKGEEGQGYTCGLWEIIHAATVGVVPYNRDVVTDSKLLAPAKVAKTIRDYIEHFFQCDDCRRNFLTMFDNCGHDHCKKLKKKAKLGLAEASWDWEQPALFFYEVHNAVNVRLMREKAGREKWEPTRQNILDVQWPPQYECRPCWKRDANGNQVWEEKMVIQYLKLEYGLRNADAATFKRKLSEMNDKMLEEEHQEVVIEQTSFLPSELLQEFMFLNCIVGVAVVVISARRRKKRRLARQRAIPIITGKPQSRNKHRLLKARSSLLL